MEVVCGDLSLRIRENFEPLLKPLDKIEVEEEADWRMYKACYDYTQGICSKAQLREAHKNTENLSGEMKDEVQQLFKYLMTDAIVAILKGRAPPVTATLKAGYSYISDDVIDKWSIVKAMERVKSIDSTDCKITVLPSEYKLMARVPGGHRPELMYNLSAEAMTEYTKELLTKNPDIVQAFEQYKNLVARYPADHIYKPTERDMFDALSREDVHRVHIFLCNFHWVNDYRRRIIVFLAVWGIIIPSDFTYDPDTDGCELRFIYIHALEKGRLAMAEEIHDRLFAAYFHREETYLNVVRDICTDERYTAEQSAKLVSYVPKPAKKYSDWSPAAKELAEELKSDKLYDVTK